jgi:secreted PhoX family phosphatase
VTDLDRRSLLKTGAAVAVGTAVVGGPFQGLVAQSAGAVGSAPDFRKLRPLPDLRDGKVRLHLPEGFSYRSFDDNEAGARLTEGGVVPGRHDGMAAFAGSGTGVTLVRNHEVALPAGGNTTAFGVAADAYDPKAPAGCTTVEVDLEGVVSRSYASLNGTLQNCSGGPMPWGSWMSCEETVNGPDVGPDFTGVPNTFLTKRHGYIFEVPKDSVSDATPVRNAGRFAHESVAWDPHTKALYLSEDNFGFPSGFYKYVPPNDPDVDGYLADGGQLYMLAVSGQDNANLAASQPQRATYHVDWVKIDQPDFGTDSGPVQQTNDHALVHVSRQGAAKGAAYFSRLEGTIFDGGVVYFTSTQGGGTPEANLDPVTAFETTVAGGFGNGSGQVWAYHTRSQTLQLIFESPGPLTLDLPDNVTTSRRGTLVVCEDNVNDNFIRGLSRGGQLFDIALNRLRSSTNVDRSNDEFAGSTFSPGGHTLYVNIQASRGMTFAIWGPWERIGV